MQYFLVSFGREKSSVYGLAYTLLICSFSKLKKKPFNWGVVDGDALHLQQ